MSSADRHRLAPGADDRRPAQPRLVPL